jgi:acyl-CoA thioesterase FadM
LCFLIGSGAAIIFVLGYVQPIPLFLTFASLIALIGALPSIIGLFRPQQSPGTAVQTVVDDAAGAPSVLIPLLPPEAVASQGFDGQWFVMQLMPTYDDTNSVGNIYFANYVRWVGKARELFFNVCMPLFDLKTTQYYVLTRSFTHDFRMEAKEFEAITVRIRISGHNRKFVTLDHEVFSSARGMLGRGQQTLMFVNTENNRPLDIPGDIIRGFLPYWPKDSRIYQKLQSNAQSSPVG